jgi:hypothetical protein
MRVAIQSDRQTVKSAQVEINVSDLVSSGMVQNVIKLPAGAVVIGGAVHTLVAFNSGSADVLNVGDAQSANRYLSNANIRAINATPISLSGKRTATPEWITASWTGTGAPPTAGRALLHIEYIQTGVGEGNQD